MTRGDRVEDSSIMVCGVSAYLSLVFGTLMTFVDPGPSQPSGYSTTVELGSALSVVYLKSLYGKTEYCSYGVKLSYPWRDHVLVEGAYSHFVNASEEHAHSLVLMGLRGGIRKRKFGAFVKVLPGMIRIVETPYPSPPPFHKFALSVGGVVEAHLDPRLYIRIDQGYLIMWLGDTEFHRGTPRRPGTSGYYHWSVGLGVRF